MKRPADSDPRVATPGTRDPAPDRSSRPAGLLVLGFAIVGLVTVVLSGLATMITKLPLTAEFGLLQLLPPTYWVGLSMIGLSVYLALRSGRVGLFVISGVLFFAVFVGTPALFEPNPPVWDGYFHLGEALDIGLMGRLPGDPLAYSANWPGFFLTVWMLSTLTGVPAVALLGIYPFFAGALTFVALFVFLNWVFGPRTAMVGSVLGSLLNVWAQFHLSPQSIGLVLALLVLATLWRKRIPFRVAASVLFVGLVVSHPTSTILILGILIVDVVVRLGLRLRSRAAEPSREGAGRFAFNPALAYGVTWAAWLFFLAAGSSQAAETVIIAEIGRILQVPEQALNLATARSLESVLVLGPQIRLVSLASFGVVGLAALIVLSRRVASRGLAVFLWAALVSLVLFALADILFFGGSLYDRGLMLFALVTPALGVAALAAMRLRRPVRRGVLVAFLLLSVASASTIYAQEVFYFVSDRAVATSGFLERVEPGANVFDGFFPVPVWVDAESRTRYAVIGFFTVHPRALEEFDTTSAAYAVYDGTAELWYRQWRGVEVLQFYQANRAVYSLIYDNGGTTIDLIALPGPAG
ncbi:MAG: hypothetical protein ACE5I4_00625 [Thermoplasmata archaeon]